mgnify:FL=1
MAHEALPCVVDTITYEVVTYDSLRELVAKIREKEDELINMGIEKKYIDDLIDDIENSSGPVCGSRERIETYIAILDLILED